MASPCPACGRDGARVLAAFQSDTFGDPRPFEHRECPACGMVFVHPLPSEADLAALYAHPRYYTLTDTEPLLTSGFRDRPAWKVGEYAVVLNGLRKRLAPPARVLDVGCGWGLFLECASDAGFAPEGLDPSAEVVGYVQDRLGLAARVATLETEPAGIWDAVTMLDVLEHVRDPVGFARLARRALKPGGWLVVRVPNFAGFTNLVVPGWLTRLRRQEPRHFLQHLSEFRTRSLAATLTAAGFGNISVGGTENFRRHYRKPVVRRLAWQALSAVAVVTGRPCALIGYAQAPAG